MKRFSTCVALLIAFAASAVAAEPYAALAGELAQKSLPKLSQKKVAVLPFEYMTGRVSFGGRVVAEKLTYGLVEDGRLAVIERSLVDKLIGELKFQASGAIDPDTAKEIGKGLGVEAIITGTLEDINSGKVSVNARVIKTESYEILAVAAARVKKTWQDAPAPASDEDAARGAPASLGGRLRKSRGK